MRFFKMMLEENKDMEHAHDALSRKKTKKIPRRNERHHFILH